MTTNKATITVKSVGRGFGVRGEVRSASGALVAETRVFPHNHRPQAYSAAERLALAAGYQIEDNE